MDLVTLLWTLASTFFAGLALFIQKIVAEEDRSPALFSTIAFGISGFLAIIVLITLNEVPTDWQIISFYGVIAGISIGLANLFRIQSLKYIDSVLYFPLHKLLAPLLVVAGGIVFFAEDLSTIQLTGIVLSLTVPLLLITSVEHHRQKKLGSGLKLLFISGILSAASILLSKQGLQYASSISIFLVTSQLAGSAISAAVLFKQQGLHYSTFLRASQRDIYLSAISGLLSFLCTVSLFMAFRTGLVSVVYVIQAHYILIPIVLSVWWYGDHINMRKFIAVMVSFLAIGLLAI